MTPAPSTFNRLSLLGCLLLGTLAPALPGCGGGGAATADATSATKPKPPTEAAAASSAGAGEPCPPEVGSFADSLRGMRRRLAVGLSYDQYAAGVEKLHSAYDAIPTDRLELDCLNRTGTAAEQAFTEYIGAANAWGECLADASCATAQIEPILQRRWRVASHLLGEAA